MAQLFTLLSTQAQQSCETDKLVYGTREQYSWAQHCSTYNTHCVLTIITTVRRPWCTSVYVTCDTPWYTTAHVTCDTPAHRRQHTHTPGLTSHISTCTDCHRLRTQSVIVQSATALTSDDQSLTTTTIFKLTNTHRTTNGQLTKSTSVNCAAAQLLIKSDHKLHNHVRIAVFS